MKKIRVGVVFGGRSAEHEVSLQSAKNVLEALDRSRYEPVLIGIDREGRWRLDEQTKALFESARPLPNLTADLPHEVALVARGEQSRLLDLSGDRELGKLDVVFPVLHGPYGEDGSVQGLCRLANLPCVGAGILGSAVGMDKDVMKRLLREAGIPTARSVTLLRGRSTRDFASVSAELGTPLFVKPANLGSSVGISRVQTAAEYERACAAAFQYDTKLVVEECIIGREVECAVLGNSEPRASVPGEIVTGGGHTFYDYEAKYIDEHGARLLIPAPLEPAVTERVRQLALQAFTVLCCEGMARVDMFVKENGEVLINEINTIPGFTRISMYPKLWEASGVSYSQLVDQLITLAIERAATERELKTTP
ncbi:MAG TPA: D-alanine--D-alanine ligase [Spirochaetia bacterium]|nr:D-alanine--D-alanine ligase [Spirochaetia bacterium]